MKSMHTAERLVRLVAEDHFHRMRDAQINSMKNYLTPAQHAALRVAFNTVLTFELFLPAVASEYASRFTEQEMQAFIDLFSSPVGQRWLAVNAEVITASTEVCQKLTETRKPQIMEIFNSQLRLLDCPDQVDCIAG